MGASKAHRKTAASFVYGAMTDLADSVITP